MSKEISNMMMQCSLEAGELFGVSREDMVSRLENPDRLERRWVGFDWEEYRALMRFVFGHIGTGPVLVTAGQRYLNERYRTRSAHLYAQYTNWERMLWVAKTLMAGRMMKGYRIDYTEKGSDRFEVTMEIPDHLEGFPDFFYFLTGVWTGSSPQAKLQHTIHSLAVFPHRAVADITFDKRSLYSRVAYNPFYSRLKSLLELKRCRREMRKVSTALARETENLDTAFNAVSNAVFLVREREIVLANGNARSLLKNNPDLEEAFSAAFLDGGRAEIPEQWSTSGRVFRVRSQTLENHEGKERLVSLEDQTHLLELEAKLSHGPAEIRREAEAKLEQTLGGTIDELVRLIGEVAQSEPDKETRDLLASLDALARHCRRQGLALVEGAPPSFGSDRELMDAIRELAREFYEVFGFTVTLEGDTLPPMREPRERGVFFLMIQEVLRNAWRHSGMREARMECTPDFVRITDRGRGFSGGACTRHGLGVASIRARAELLGLRVECVQGHECGWTFSAATRLEFVS